MMRLTSLVLLIPLAVTAQEPFAAVARWTFFELLKNSSEAPMISPTLHQRVTEQGLVIEDLRVRPLVGIE